MMSFDYLMDICTVERFQDSIHSVHLTEIAEKDTIIKLFEQHFINFQKQAQILWIQNLILRFKTFHSIGDRRND